MACIEDTGLAFIIAAIVNTASTALLSWFNGGASSNSIKPALGGWIYTKDRFLRDSKRAVISIWPPSPWAALNFLCERAQLSGISFSE